MQSNLKQIRRGVAVLATAFMLTGISPSFVAFAQVAPPAPAAAPAEGSPAPAPASPQTPRASPMPGGIMMSGPMMHGMMQGMMQSMQAMMAMMHGQMQHGQMQPAPMACHRCKAA